MNKHIVKEVDGFDEAMIDQIVSELDKSDIEDTDKYVMKELISSKDEDIYFKTELTIKQIKAIIQMRTADKLIVLQSMQNKYKGTESEKEVDSVIHYMTDMLMRLLVSMDRKGRGEFIDAYGRKREEQNRGGFFNRFLGN